MFLRELRKITRPHWFDLLFHIKRSKGISVTDLSKKFKMSYMGVKQHCGELKKRGYLDTWRTPSSQGRPEMLYRVTERGNVFFPNLATELTLDILASVRETYGETAPEKLIFGYLAKKTLDYQRNIKGDTIAERAASFAAIRNREGFLCDFVRSTEDGEPMKVVEFHNPLENLFKAYPRVVRMEQAMIENVLGCFVNAHCTESSGLKQTEYELLGPIQ